METRMLFKDYSGNASVLPPKILEYKYSEQYVYIFIDLTVIIYFSNILCISY